MKVVVGQGNHAMSLLNGKSCLDNAMPGRLESLQHQSTQLFFGLNMTKNPREINP